MKKTIGQFSLFKGLGALVAHTLVAIALAGISAPCVLALDYDGDGVDDDHDCAPQIASVWAFAGEVEVLEWNSKVEMQWRPEALAQTYDVHRGTIGDGNPFAYTHGCFAAHRITSDARDNDDPPTGTLFYYLVGGRNACGEGSLGAGSSGPRPTNLTCPPMDGDSDGVADDNDNCVLVANPGQEDPDHDGLGSACDLCPTVSDPVQADKDNDGDGDACDNCPAAGNSDQADGDGDHIGDACDSCPTDSTNDADTDGVCGQVDNCPANANADQGDQDRDGIGDACDGNGTMVISEVFYDQNASEQEFAELYVPHGPIDITGWSVSDREVAPFTFSTTDSAFTCGQPFVLAQGDRVLIWQGAGTPVCSGPVRKIFLNRGPAWSRDGDDLVLRDRTGICRDYVAYEDGAEVGTPPADCAWTGPNPSNGNARHVSISRRDRIPFVDTDQGSDWEASGATTTAGPASPGFPNEPGLADRDGDEVADAHDNCPDAINPAQSDVDADGIGDICDGCAHDPANDADADGRCGDVDNCPAAANSAQTDVDGDGSGDACDLCPLDAMNDADADGRCANADNCPLVANPSQADSDNDGVGDDCDPCPGDTVNDNDHDGVCGALDNCPLIANADQTDADGDGLGDPCDRCPSDSSNDQDGDGVCGAVDNCPSVANSDQSDTDGDGIGDRCEPLAVISEVHYDQAAGQQEFVELLVLHGSIDMTGWKLSDREDMTLTFSPSDHKFPCTVPFVVNPGDRVVVWQGTGISVCSGPVRSLFIARSGFMPRTGDDIMLEDSTGHCRDYVAAESGPQVGAPPAGCAWTGPNPTNGDVEGTSISRFDASPFRDTDTGADWEASGATRTTGPATPGQANQAGPSDSDGDGIADPVDNCSLVANPDQADDDGDSTGNVCDNCPVSPNADQADGDSDGHGDLCDPCPNDVVNDVDGDGSCASSDNCPSVANPSQSDADHDGLGDACDACPTDSSNDSDGDGVCGSVDNCPSTANPNQADSDGDGAGDACDLSAVAGVFINEVLYDQGSGGQEAIELYAVTPTDMSGWTIADQDQFLFTFSTSSFPCPLPFQVNTGDHIVLYQGSGTSSCAGPVKRIYMNRGTFLAASGDDLVLRSADSACRDYVAFENGTSVNSAPSGCAWTGPNPSNGDTAGRSIARFDAAPFVDSNAGSDWEASGATTTTGPHSLEVGNQTGGGGGGGGTVSVDIPIVDQDVRSDGDGIAQHFQQASKRVGRRGSVRYRTLSWFDVSGIPAGSSIQSVKIMYTTTSGDPGNIDTNGDTAPSGGPITVEVREVLKPWNFDEPLTYPPSLTDNELPVAAGLTSWRYSLHPAQWQSPGANGTTDSGPAIATTIVTPALDTGFEFSSPGLADAVQRWISGTAPNYGFLLRAIDADEAAGVDDRKVFCGKGFPLETTTGLAPSEAQSHRPFVRIEYLRP